MARKINGIVYRDRSDYPYIWYFTDALGKKKAIKELFDFLDEELFYALVNPNIQEEIEAEKQRAAEEIKSTYLANKVTSALKEAMDQIDRLHEDDLLNFHDYQEAKKSKSADVKWSYIQDFLGLADCGHAEMVAIRVMNIRGKRLSCRSSC